MIIMFDKLLQNITLSILILLSSSYGLALESIDNAAIVQPGAPGQPTRDLDAKTAVAIADSSYSNADVQFMQGMMVHHYQALLMSRFAPQRTNNQAILDLAGRIDVSQDDEISFMRDWLTERIESVPDITSAHAKHMSHMMEGMASEEQMAQLGGSKSTGFDELFLTLMIKHHDGAIEMVKDLREQSGSAYDPQLNEFASDVTNDQTVEIERMNGLLIGLSSDPRAGLSAGLFDAEEAIMNMQLFAAQRKPPGFFDPANPSARGNDGPKKATELGGGEVKEEDEKRKPVEDAADDRRYPMLSFSNTDMAFRDDLLVTGSYHGFNMYQIDDTGLPILTASVVCPGGQGDVSIVGDLLIMSVEQTRGRLDCGLQGVSEDISAERFRGIRIFDISDLTRPLQVGAVQTCRGSHTHSVVSGPSADGKILVYNSGTSSVRKEEELENCIDGTPGDDRTALFRIDVIEIPIDDPSKSRIIDSPTVFSDTKSGVLAGLWRGGDHGDDTQETHRTDQCHDITVFPTAKLAAGACSGNGILFDISDPRKPTRIDVVTDAGFAYWHSATFNNEGTKILFTDEWGGGRRSRCRAWDPMNWGADAIYDIVDQQLKFQAHYKMPAPQSETENCVAHNGAIIPVPGRDIFVQAWYQGGISVVDFTDSSSPIEIAYFDRGPVHEEDLLTGGYWSAYYYQGSIYGTEIVRGLDVLKLLPSEYLSQDEINAAAMAYPITGPKQSFNPQQQVPMTWPAAPEVANAYIDQLLRANKINKSGASRLKQLLSQVGNAMDAGGDNTLARKLGRVKISAKNAIINTQTADRLKKLHSALKGIAKGLEN